MKGLSHIGRLGGIPVRVHWLTALLPVGALAYGAYRGIEPAGLAWLLAFVLGVITCVLFHEAAHAWAARYFGVQVHDILLLPVGGAARLRRLPDTPLQESGVVLAGPLVNLLLGLLLLPVAYALPDEQRYFWEGHFTAATAVATLAVFNLIVFAINLAPVFPLDGGRLLRALLSARMPRLRATKIAAAVARFVVLAALALVVYLGDSLLVLPLLYFFVVAGREVHLATVQQFLESESLGRHAAGVRVFDPAEPIGELLHQLERNGQAGAVIADECSPIGFVTAELLRRAPDPSVHVGDLEMHMVVCHDSHATLKDISRQFSRHPRSVAVEELDGRPAGYLDLDGLSAAFEHYREELG